MGFVRLLPRSSSRARDAAAEAELELEAASELEVDVSEIDAGDAIGMPALDHLPVVEELPAAVSHAGCVGTGRDSAGACARSDRNARHRAREPEGWRREDHDDAEPRRRVQGDGLPGAARRSRPSGQPDDEPGTEPRHDRDLDVRRARAEDPDLGRDRAARGRPCRRLDRSRRRRARARRADRPRALAREGARSRCATATTSSSSTRRRHLAC